jgi:Glycine-zipper domain
MLIKLIRSRITLLAVLVLSGCATLPTGPSVLVLPAAGKPLEQFQTEDMICRQWAGQQIGMSAQDTVNQNTAKGAAVGTMIGAGAGALLGAASGHAGAGAAIGAGSGLLLGTASGAGAGQEYGWEAQRKYDYGYVQCMYAKGNQIPGQVHQYRVRRINPPPPRPHDMNSVPPDYVPN